VSAAPSSPGRRQPLNALDPKIDAVRLQLKMRIDVLDERRHARERGAKLFSREDGHRMRS
jgi:hypothetical protein